MLVAGIDNDICRQVLSLCLGAQDVGRTIAEQIARIALLVAEIGNNICHQALSLCLDAQDVGPKLAEVSPVGNAENGMV